VPWDPQAVNLNRTDNFIYRRFWMLSRWLHQPNGRQIRGASAYLKVLSTFGRNVLVPLPILWRTKMAVSCGCLMPVNSHQSTQRYNPEGSHLRTHCRENFKLYFVTYCCDICNYRVSHKSSIIGKKFKKGKTKAFIYWTCSMCPPLILNTQT
jgi:hypothetical protein